MPTLPLHSTASDAGPVAMTAAVAREIPHAEVWAVPGEWHGPADDALAATLRAACGPR